MSGDISIVGHEHPAILGVQANSMGVLQSSSVPAEHPKRFVLSLGVLVIDHYHRWVLDGQQHFVTGFVHCNSVGSVRGAQFPGGVHIAALVA